MKEQKVVRYTAGQYTNRLRAAPNDVRIVGTTIRSRQVGRSFGLVGFPRSGIAGIWGGVHDASHDSIWG